MKEQLDRLVELARRYREYGNKIQLPDDHNDLRECVGCKRIGPRIQVYFADQRKTCAVYFHKIEVSLYSNNITIPADSTTESIEAVIQDVTSFLENELQEDIQELKDKFKAEKLDRIRQMEATLEHLKAETNNQ